MGYFQTAKCRNCGAPISRFISTAFGDDVEPGRWVHAAGMTQCVVTTVAEPEGH